jgi:hypothetical protein
VGLSGIACVASLIALGLASPRRPVGLHCIDLRCVRVRAAQLDNLVPLPYSPCNQSLPGRVEMSPTFLCCGTFKNSRGSKANQCSAPETDRCRADCRCSPSPRVRGRMPRRAEGTLVPCEPCARKGSIRRGAGKVTSAGPSCGVAGMIMGLTALHSEVCEVRSRPPPFLSGVRAKHTSVR